MIPQIQDPIGNLISDPEEINSIFKFFFYATIYTSEAPSDSQFLTFLHNLNVTTIDSADATILNAPLDIKEIIQAIKSMRCNKAPGPDGFPVKFLKKLSKL